MKNNEWKEKDRILKWVFDVFSSILLFFFGLDAKVLKSISHEREVHLTYITSNFLLYRDNFWLQVTIIR